MELDLELFEQQSQFLYCDAPFSALVGGVGSGKTHAGVAKTLYYCIKHPGCLGMVVAPTFPLLRDGTLRKVFELFPESFIADWKVGDQQMLLANGSELLFRSADEPDRLRAVTAAFFHLDEGALAKALVFEILQGRLRQVGFPHQGWITTTPKGFNWVWQEFAREVRANYKVFFVSSRLNPYLPPNYIANLKESYGDTEFALQEIEGKFVMVGGKPFFPPEAVGSMYDDCHEPQEVREGCISIWKSPVIGGKYVAGCDPCWGETGAYACTVVHDWQTGEQVAEIHGRIQPDEMADKTVRLCREYSDAYLGIEANGEGRVAVNKAVELGYGPRMYHRDDDWRSKENQRGWWTDSKTRPLMLGELEEAVRHRHIRVRCKDIPNEMMSFIRTEKGKPEPVDEKSYSDHIIAEAIMWQMRKHARFYREKRELKVVRLA